MTRPLLAFGAIAVLSVAIAATAVWSQTTPPATPEAADAMSATPPAAAAAAAAGLPGTAQLWQITRQTTIAGQAPETRTVSVCSGPDDLKTPPIAITGPQCPQQIFSPEGGMVSWVSECDAARAKGSITVSSDNQSLAGDIVDTLGNATVHLSGVVTGTCSKS